MAAELSSVGKWKTSGFMTILSSAGCEWFLIFLLFVDAVFTYLITRFAYYCKLQLPCPLCSRLDHSFGKKKPGCYWSLVCSNHKEEISSLVSCSTHGKLAHAHRMCEDCLMPIAMQNNSKTHKLLVGKLWVDVERSVTQNLMLNKHIKLDSSDSRICSCCNKTRNARPDAERLLKLKQVELGASNSNAKPPLPRVPCHKRLRRLDSLKRLRGKLTAPMRIQPAGSNSVDSLSHIGYTKLKLSSDSESELPLSEDDDDDDDDGNVSSSGNNYMKPAQDVGFGRRDLPRTVVNNVVLQKQTHQGSELKDQPDLLDLDEPKNVNTPLTDGTKENCLRELSSAESYHKSNPQMTTEQISLNDVSQPPGVRSLGVSGEASNFSFPHFSAVSAVSEFPSSNSLADTKKSVDIGETCENVNLSATVHIEAVSETSLDDTCPSKSHSKNLTDSLNQSTKKMEISCEHEVDSFDASNSARTEEDMKSMSQVSTSEVGLSLKDTSPRPHYEYNESRKAEDSSYQALSLSASLKRNDSSYESLDGISVSDIEGENFVDRLRRQVEHDRSCIKFLYKELEEERNAAAVAANQAMAMITRLQEEKAGLQMETLQYLRVMEEQSEYDVKALERANDLLCGKEKELQDMETELEFYRNNLPDKLGIEDL